MRVLERVLRRLIGWLAVASLGLAGAVWADTREELFKAASMDAESVIVGMALKGLNLNTVDEEGRSALLIAATENSLKVARFLLEQPQTKVGIRNAQGESPLMMAAIKGHLEMVRLLIDHKAEVNKPGWTPLHYASANPEASSTAIVALLLEKYAYIDAESPNKTTPLMMAARYGHADAVKLLLQEGADASLRNQQGMTAVDFARSIEREDIARQIESFGPVVPATGKW